MDDQNKNLLLATSLSFLVLLGWMLMFPPEPIEEVPSEQRTEQVSQERGETGTGLSTPVQVDTKQKGQRIFSCLIRLKLFPLPWLDCFVSKLWKEF